MEVYSAPAHLPAPVPNYANYDSVREQQREAEHQAKLAAWLISQGYTGPKTGKIVRWQVADGYAVYMVADGTKFKLIHLPYGDGYQWPYMDRLIKQDVLEQIERQEKLAALFAKKGA